MTDLPQRPRRRVLTPLTGGLAAVIVAAGGFAAGAQAQKSRGTSANTAAGPTGMGGMPAGGPPGMANASQPTDGTAGTVSYVKGNVLYVKDADGNTVKVKVKSSADVTRNAVTDAEKIQPGDTVTVQGAANGNGTVSATAVTATEAPE